MRIRGAVVTIVENTMSQEGEKGDRPSSQDGFTLEERCKFKI